MLGRRVPALALACINSISGLVVFANSLQDARSAEVLLGWRPGDAQSLGGSPSSAQGLVKTTFELMLLVSGDV